MNKNSIIIKKTALAAIFLVFGWVLPFVTGRIPEIGNMLCPMHIPVMLCGFILGPWYGLAIGFITPITRHFLFGMPAPLFPIASSMAFELATYGFVTGLLYIILLRRSKIKHIILIYFILIISMLSGRVVWGIARVLSGLFTNSSFTWKIFLTSGFVTAWPGIMIQLILIPTILEVLFQLGMVQRLTNCDDNKNISKILRKVKTLLKTKDTVVIAIDGMAASGKTTLASVLAKKLDANVIHTDDFYLPASLRTDEMLNQICCNIDYQRVKDEVISHLNAEIIYHKFDCKQMQQTEEIKLEPKKVIIIEGAYAMHPKLGKYYDVAIFLKTQSVIQEQRILNRDGVSKLQDYKDKWILLENQYFDKYQIASLADMVFEN